MSVAFNPRLYVEPGTGEFYADGTVLGAVDQADLPQGGKSLVIHEWSSLHHGEGNTVRALTWLRGQGFSIIAANGVGRVEDGVGDIATAYWMHMHAKGLVDTLLDDDGQDITPAARAVQI